MIDSPFGARSATCKHGAVLGDVDLFSAKHRFDALAQTRLFRQLNQEFQRLVGDAILRVIEKDSRRLKL